MMSIDVSLKPLEGEELLFDNRSTIANIYGNKKSLTSGIKVLLKILEMLDFAEQGNLKLKVL